MPSLKGSPQFETKSPYHYHPVFYLVFIIISLIKTIRLLVICMGVKLCTTLREEYTLRVFENMVLRKIFGSKRDEVTEEWRKLCIPRNFMIRTHHKILFV